MRSDGEDIGHDHRLSYFSWSPDRDLNPQYVDIPDIDKAGTRIDHKKPDGSECASAIHFDLPGSEHLSPGSPRWQVIAWEPLTISPSLLCRLCGDHGFIREGRWVPA